METEAGSQIALENFPRANPPFLAHQFFPGGKTLDNMSGGRHASLPSRGACVDSSPTSHRLGSLEQGPCNGHRMDWDVKQWEWDSVLFLAQPSSSAAAISDRTRNLYYGVQNGHSEKSQASEANGVGLRLDGGVSSSPDQNGSSDHDDPHASQRGKHPASDEDNWQTSHSGKAQPFLRDGSSPEEDGESLSLKLGGHSYAYSDEGGFASRDAKRYRSSSPGPQFPSCQVDDCKADLSNAKDYHRRHKVCEMHAKAVKALVSRLMQRFCQQCSRFHPLTEFDEGKRSCRRRLAGHNRRRRKNQPDPPAGRGFAGLDENGSGNALGLMGFLNILSSLQAVSSVGALNGIINERDALLQYLRKGALSPPSGLDNLTTASIANLLNMSGGLENGRTDLKPQSFATNGQPQSSVAEAEALLSALAAPKTNDALSLLLQNNLRGQLTSALMKAGETPLVQVGQCTSNSTLPMATPSAAVPSNVALTNAGPSLSPAPVMPARPLTMHNFASSSRPNGAQQQLLGENSVHRVDQFQGNLLQGQVTPVGTVQKLFRQVQASESRSNGQFVLNVEDDRATESTSDLDAPGSMMSLLEGQDARTLQDVTHHSRPAIDLQQPALQYDMNESSPSGSDQSPSSSYADWQDRTGRISIKLFDRNPGELPQLLRSQILEWLAHRPSDMESYIRPGCTVLTVFLSMPRKAWVEVERDLRVSLPKLIGNGDFWSLGRIHLQVDRRNAYVTDGKVYISKPLKSMTAPQLLSVRPFAVVAGQRTNIVLRGWNLRRSGARIFSAYQGRYSAKEILLSEGQQGLGTSLGNSADDEIGYDELSISFDGGCPGVVGRAFIEVEKQMGGGNALPVIVADGPICAELQMLEENWTQFSNDGARGSHPDDVLEGTRMIEFLNELGWLFQSSQTHLRMTELPKLLPSRQKHLLTFAVKRDWCAVVHKLLDILFGLVLSSPKKTSMVLLDIFGDEMSLLHLAVERKCIPMVQLLLSYVPPLCERGSADLKDLLQEVWKHGQQSIFSPNMRGPEGRTPLHIAACMRGAEGIIDALTSDPNQIGLDTWSYALDTKGESPLACAVRSGNGSYIKLVRDKIAKRDGSVVVTVAPQEKVSSTVGKASNTGGKTSSTAGKTTSSVRTTPLCALELPVWSSKGLLENSGRGKPFVYPNSCRHVPPTLRGYKTGSSMHRPFWISMLCVAAVCVCACIIMKGPPNAMSRRAFSWGSLGSGYK
ncbi:unnamed protein product [Calypogeia fissa]